MTQGEGFWQAVVLQSRREDFAHAVLGRANANLELLHVAWMF